jgi:pimeloyl-ACP methyl ester carboxylesterase
MSKKDRSLTVKRIVIAVVLIAVGLLLVWGIQWATYARPPLPEAIDRLESDDVVTVTFEPWLTFAPAVGEPNTGFIFYPGGRIDPGGYATLMHAIASEGYLVVIPEMPLNMAIFNSGIADAIMEQHPEIDHWVIAGHSVGGVAAAIYADQNREIIDGLMIWAAYPADSSDLSDAGFPVILIYASLDPRASEESVAERKHLLPENAQYVRIEGGGHHQFGSYQIKPEEHQATISRTDQHAQILEVTLELLAAVSEME